MERSLEAPGVGERLPGEVRPERRERDLGLGELQEQVVERDHQPLQLPRLVLGVRRRSFRTPGRESTAGGSFGGSGRGLSPALGFRLRPEALRDLLLLGRIPEPCLVPGLAVTSETVSG